ncbi:hypothetical protein KCU79_g134, partial [Aureobasidium melanogenum]
MVFLQASSFTTLTVTLRRTCIAVMSTSATDPTIPAYAWLRTRLPVMTKFFATPTVIFGCMTKLFAILAMILRAVTEFRAHIAVVICFTVDLIAHVTMIIMAMTQQ